MKIKRIRVHRIEWVRVVQRVKANLSPITRQAALETVVNAVVNKLNAINAACRVEYQNNRARVFATNGQKVDVRLVV